MRRILSINPEKHIDISSILYFSGMLSAVLPVDFYDYRPAQIKLTNLESKQADLTKLHFESNSIRSLSCMHTLEHVGLGRYGDPIVPDSDLLAASELERVVAPGGLLYFVTPTGKPRIEYNAHRIYSYEMVLRMFPDMELVEFSLVPDNAFEVGIVENATSDLADKQSYGCGCYIFRKK
jgi:predicted SAM-dependent methyltransferase